MTDLFGNPVDERGKNPFTKGSMVMVKATKRVGSVVKTTRQGTVVIDTEGGLEEYRPDELHIMF